MEILVPTVRIHAGEMCPGDIIVERAREGMEPWRGRHRVQRLVLDMESDFVEAVLQFPSTVCKIGCEVDPRSCRHYGQGGGMVAAYPGGEEVVVIR